MNLGGVLDYSVLPPAPPCHFPPPANLRCGTGVFLPRVDAYRYVSTPPPTAKGNETRALGTLDARGRLGTRASLGSCAAGSNPGRRARVAVSPDA